jgi:hypothetical protein
VPDMRPIRREFDVDIKKPFEGALILQAQERLWCASGEARACTNAGAGSTSKPS